MTSVARYPAPLSPNSHDEFAQHEHERLLDERRRLMQSLRSISRQWEEKCSRTSEDVIRKQNSLIKEQISRLQETLLIIDRGEEMDSVPASSSLPDPDDCMTVTGSSESLTDAEVSSGRRLAALEREWADNANLIRDTETTTTSTYGGEEVDGRCPSLCNTDIARNLGIRQGIMEKNSQIQENQCQLVREMGERDGGWYTAFKTFENLPEICELTGEMTFRKTMDFYLKGEEIKASEVGDQVVLSKLREQLSVNSAQLQRARTDKFVKYERFKAEITPRTPSCLKDAQEYGHETVAKDPTMKTAPPPLISSDTSASRRPTNMDSIDNCRVASSDNWDFKQHMVRVIMADHELTPGEQLSRVRALVDPSRSLGSLDKDYWTRTGSGSNAYLGMNMSTTETSP